MEDIKHKNSLLNDKLKYYIDAIAKYCDRCGSPYTVDDLKMISDSGATSIIHFSCSNCKSRHIATFIKPIGVSSRMPINTDLNIDEISKFAGGKKVSVDDVLEVYDNLKREKVKKV